MNLFLSKFIRSITSKDNIPKKCYYYLQLPDSTNCLCDCVNTCKFKPPTIVNFKYINNYYQHHQKEIYILQKKYKQYI